MTNTDLGACELFISELRRSGLVERGQLDPLLEGFLRRNPTTDPDALAEYLIAQGTLTKFQVERIRTGKTQGLVLGPYVLTDAVGSGSMGTVHKAVSKSDNKSYAVKVLPRRSMWNVRLARRQVRAFSQFSHPAVVPFVDVGTAGGLHYLVWPFVEGETLDALVQRHGKLDPLTSAQVAQQVASGLAQAHAAGLFHGLLKPSNIMIGAGGQVRILDFGIGSLLAENEGESLVDTMSTANTLTSGLDCSSPESIMEPTNRTQAGDQYSLGCVLYYCLTGRYPFAEGSAVEKMMAHQFKQPTPVTDLAPETPPELAVIVDRLMQKKPEDRFPNMHDALEALTPLVPALPTATLLHGATQALTQTPTSPVTVAGLGHARLLSAPTVPAPDPMSLVNPDLMPRVPGPRPSSQVVKRPSSIVQPPKPLSAEVRPAGNSNPGLVTPPPPPLQLPTRRSMRGEAPAQTVHPVQSQYSPEEISAPQPVQPYVAPTPQPEPEKGAMMGPMGLLALGATVAITCFMIVHNLLK